MVTKTDILEIELEDVGGTSWWAGITTTLAAQSGNAYMRFVGSTNGHRRYTGDTFPAPRSLGTLSPQEAWAPGMTRSLEELCREIEKDGWVEVGHGADPWAHRYQRSAAYRHD